MKINKLEEPEKNKWMKKLKNKRRINERKN